ncbi:MAG: type I phosphomannose isomerase catalytic subunit [Mycoplasmatales bacterium]
MSLHIFDSIHIDKIWGSEDWLVSSHPNGLSLDKDGRTIKDIFGYETNLLTKIINAEDDLSVQVHPDDKFAKKHESSLGKTECWYVLSAKEGAQLIIGHSAPSVDVLIDSINNNTIDKFMNVVDIKEGDFFFIPAGTIHAIKGGCSILEVQQSSDITYRLYDYNRLENDKPRDLHLDKASQVISESGYTNSIPTASDKSQYKDTTFIRSKFFTFKRIETKDEEVTIEFGKPVTGTPNSEVIINDKKIMPRQGFVSEDGKLTISSNAEVFIAYV